eukprot:3501155-Pleurochrysis_carterae.AAC.1
MRARSRRHSAYRSLSAASMSSTRRSGSKSESEVSDRSARRSASSSSASSCAWISSSDGVGDQRRSRASVCEELVTFSVNSTSRAQSARPSTGTSKVSVAPPARANRAALGSTGVVVAVLDRRGEHTVVSG